MRGTKYAIHIHHIWAPVLFDSAWIIIHDNLYYVPCWVCVPQVVISKLKINKARKEILERKKRETPAEKKGKFTEADVNLAGVD